MIINDYAFWQLWKFKEERLTEELERRRISRERQEERRSTSREHQKERRRISRGGQKDDMDQNTPQTVTEEGVLGSVHIVNGMNIS